LLVANLQRLLELDRGEKFVPIVRRVILVAGHEEVFFEFRSAGGDGVEELLVFANRRFVPVKIEIFDVLCADRSADHPRHGAEVCRSR